MLRILDLRAEIAAVYTAGTGSASESTAGVADEDDSSLQPGPQGGDSGSPSQGKGSGGAMVGGGASAKSPSVTPSRGESGGLCRSTLARAARPMGDCMQIPPVGLVPMFVGAGHGGRTITSCDDGKTWIE